MFHPTVTKMGKERLGGGEDKFQKKWRWEPCESHIGLIWVALQVIVLTKLIKESDISTLSVRFPH